MWLSKFFKKKKVPCTVDYAKRYKIKFLGIKTVAVDCKVCGVTYWGEDLEGLKECINKFSDCNPN